MCRRRAASACIMRGMMPTLQVSCVRLTMAPGYAAHFSERWARHIFSRYKTTHQMTRITCAVASSVCSAILRGAYQQHRLWGQVSSHQRSYIFLGTRTVIRSDVPLLFALPVLVACCAEASAAPVVAKDVSSDVGESSRDTQVAEARYFDKKIAPLLAANCLQCHSGAEPKGELDLSNHKGAVAGGESGTAIVPGNLSGSHLWVRIEADEMPPDSPLGAAEKLLVKNWIAGGARWGTLRIDPFQFSTDRRAGYDWWSLQPLRKVDVPASAQAGSRPWVLNDIDRFVRSKLGQNGLSPSPRADPRRAESILTWSACGRRSR